MTESNDKTPLKNRTFAYYRSIFNKYDKDKDGYISVQELFELIESREYDNDIPTHVVEKIHEMHDVDRDRRLDFEEFVNMINNPNLGHVFGHFITRYINWIVPKRTDPTRTVTDGEYEDEYSCIPPPVGMIIISLMEIVMFCVDEASKFDSTRSASGPTAYWFIYDPDNRKEVWRYITYMFVHVGVLHLTVNLLVQILLGIPLEMVHRWWRVLIVYFAGILAGSLFTSIVDPTVRLAGASGGVYALMTAHVATIIMNWNEMSFPLGQLLVFLIVAASDIGTAIYNRYVLDIEEHIGYAAHFAGAVVGLLVGINVLRNLSVNRTEKIIWHISIVLYVLLMGICIVWNLVYPSYFHKQTLKGRIFTPLNTTHVN
ncbi:unnamed protein product [Brassicogethes aeneus]|uniref:EF-hand domain-containing protein n=1 Tax=Brassicogethes aeneus TaxID=1431903 RepID=A0A9P0AUZ8_BRAAE|nr:unnamed protein product [Brassicogethes aeneus]